MRSQLSELSDEGARPRPILSTNPPPVPLEAIICEGKTRSPAEDRPLRARHQYFRRTESVLGAAYQLNHAVLAGPVGFEPSTSSRRIASTAVFAADGIGGCRSIRTELRARIGLLIRYYKTLSRQSRGNPEFIAERISTKQKSCKRQLVP
jgi:hypothetical protein